MTSRAEAESLIEQGVDPVLAHTVASRHSGDLGFTEEVDMGEVARQIEEREHESLFLPTLEEGEYYWGIAGIAADSGPKIGQLMLILKKTARTRVEDFKDLMSVAGMKGAPLTFALEAAEEVIHKELGETDPSDWSPELRTAIDGEREQYMDYFLRVRDALIQGIGERINDYRQ